MNGIGSGLLLVSGLLCCAAGLLYRFPAIAAADRRVFLQLHAGLSGGRPFFRWCWHLGRTPLTLLVLLVVLPLLKPSLTLPALLIYALLAGGERILKLNLRRLRPFQLMPELKVFQPRIPQDPSHPSGDALRAWYLAGLLPLACELPAILLAGLLLTALLVSLGRIALGVHFPLDVLGGTGLGLLGGAMLRLWL